jgi:hypothetical protein
MPRPLGLFRAFRFLSGRTRSTKAKPPNNFGPFAWGAMWRPTVAIVMILLTFSAQLLAECMCGGPTCCICSTPIILDVSGHGFHLTSLADGVVFDISGTGHPVQIAWTAADSGNAFLALPASDGIVHDGKQLFGNYTPQPPSNDPNGFRALAVYDLPENGGNGDGIIDARDKIFSSLRLWIDANHDGICQPEELHTLPSMGVYSISLDYWLSRKRDQYGNLFRYRSVVNEGVPDGVSEVDHVVYDVGFISASGVE